MKIKSSLTTEDVRNAMGDVQHWVARASGMGGGGGWLVICGARPCVCVNVLQHASPSEVNDIGGVNMCVIRQNISVVTPTTNLVISSYVGS